MRRAYGDPERSKIPRTWGVGDARSTPLSTHRARRGPPNEETSMATLHVSNIVRDYDSWKGNFDKFDRARRERGVRGYRIARGDEEPTRVIVDLDFDSTTRAEEFAEFLRGVMRTPQAQSELLQHDTPVVLEVTEERQLV
jgi:hypothetical protein